MVTKVGIFRFNIRCTINFHFSVIFDSLKHLLSEPQKTENERYACDVWCFIGVRKK